MRAELKLNRRGSSTGINIPRPILIHLGWLPGDVIIIELLEDKSLRLRQRGAADYVPIRSPRVVYDEHGTVTK